MSNVIVPNATAVRKEVNFLADLAAVSPQPGERVGIRGTSVFGIGSGVFIALAGSVGVGDLGRNIDSAIPGLFFQREDNIVRASDYNNQLSVAFANCPNGSIELEAIEYPPEDIVVSRGSLKVNGSRMPTVSVAKDRLEFGTVIRGRLIISGSGCTLSNLGVDRGDYVTDTYFSGVAADALVVHDETLTSQRDDNHLNAVIGLVKAGSSYHGVLFEKQANGSLNGVSGRNGHWGVVVKAVKTSLYDCTGYATTEGGVTIKSDSYAPCTDIVADNLKAFETVSGVGVFLYAASEQMKNITIGNVSTDAGEFGFKAVCSNRASDAYKMSDVTVASINCTNAELLGVQTYGAMRSFNIGKINATDTVSGNAVQVGDDSLGVNIESVSASAPAAISGSVPSSIYLGGRFTVGSIKTVKGYDDTVKCGVTVAIDASRSWNIKKIIGAFSLDKKEGAGYTLPNGWAGIYGSFAESRYSDGKCFLSGRIGVPASPWAGKEVCFNVGANMAPLIEKYFTAAAYDGSFSKFVPVFITVKINGDVEVSQLTTASSFPATITWLSLDGIFWDVVNLHE